MSFFKRVLSSSNTHLRKRSTGDADDQSGRRGRPRGKSGATSPASEAPSAHSPGVVPRSVTLDASSPSSRQKKPDAEIIKELDDRYYVEDFDSVGTTFKDLPATISQMALEAKLDHLDRLLSIISGQLSESVRRHHTEFVQGMQQIQDISMDLTLTKNLCHSTRRYLGLADKHLVESSLRIVSKHRLKAHLEAVVSVARVARGLLASEDHMMKLLDEGHFVKAIELHGQIVEAVSTCDDIACLRALKVRFRDGVSNIKDKLEEHMRRLSENALNVDMDHFKRIVQAYLLLHDVDMLEALLQQSFIFAVDRLSREAVTRFVQNESGGSSEKLKRLTFAELCSALQPEDFLPCLLTVLGDLSDLLCSFYRLEKCFYVLVEECGEIEGHHLVPAMSPSLSQQSPRGGISISRQALWNRVQDQIGALLAGVTINSQSKMQVEDLLKVLDYSSQFMKVGRRFSGADSKRLQQSINDKCVEYVRTTEARTAEALKYSLENDMWLPLPVPKDFSIHAIREFARTKHTDELTRRRLENQSSSILFKNDKSPSNASEGDASSSSTKGGEGDVDADSTSRKNADASTSEGSTQPGAASSAPQIDTRQTPPSTNPFDFSQTSISPTAGRSSSTALEPFDTYLDKENVFRTSLAEIQALQSGSGGDRLDFKRSEEFESPTFSFKSSLPVSRTVYKRVPLVTSASLSFIRSVGRFLSIMEILDPVAEQAFNSIQDLFDLYFYSIFTMLGIAVERFFAPQSAQNAKQTVYGGGGGGGANANGSGANGSAGHQPGSAAAAGGGDAGDGSGAQWPKPPYPQLVSVVNRIRDRIYKREFMPSLLPADLNALNTRAPSLAQTNADILSPQRLTGVCERTVSAESLVFIVEIFSDLKTRFQQTFPSDASAEVVPNFIESSKKLVDEYRTYMYRNVPSFVIDLKPSIDTIVHVNWNLRSLHTTHQPYIDGIVDRFRSFLHTVDRLGGLPEYIIQRLERETIIYLQEGLVQGYAKVQKCSTEGRAAMSLDQNVLKTKLQAITKPDAELFETDPMPSWDYINSYIRGFYLPQRDLLNWVEENAHRYKLDQMLSLGRCGVEGAQMKKRQRTEYLAQVEAAYNRGLKG